MEGGDALGLIAEIGIAIAGFAGVVATLRAPGGMNGAYATLRIGSLLALSALAVLMALLPFAFHHAGLNCTKTWAISSAMMLTLLAMMMLSFTYFRTKTRLAPDESPPGMQILRPFVVAINTVTLVLQVANVAFIRELWPFYTGLLTITAIALVNFAHILLAPSRAELRP